MPIHRPPVSRRDWLRSALAGTAAVCLGRCARAEDRVDPHRLALLSDVHIAADKATRTSGTVPWDTLAQAVGEIAALDPRPAAAIINGDCAYFYGKPGDYARFIQAIGPLRKAGLPLHMTLGNHDDRRNFLKALPADDARVNDKAPADRVVSILSMPRANLFLLDSLGVTAKVEGFLGDAQMAWLAKALDARTDKPAIVFVHHNPDMRPREKQTGLIESRALFDLLAPRKHVKALFFGHTHTWNYTRHDHLHLINLPPTAWLFVPGLPQGWADLSLAEDGAALTLRCLDKKHFLNGEKIEMKWR